MGRAVWGAESKRAVFALKPSEEWDDFGALCMFLSHVREARVRALGCGRLGAGAWVRALGRGRLGTGAGAWVRARARARVRVRVRARVRARATRIPNHGLMRSRPAFVCFRLAFPPCVRAFPLRVRAPFVCVRCIRFLSVQVCPSYPKEGAAFPGQLMQLLSEQATVLAPGVRKTLVQSLALLRGKDAVPSAPYDDVRVPSAPPSHPRFPDPLTGAVGRHRALRTQRARALLPAVPLPGQGAA